jgi:uncharacterized protein (TIGR00725 family)
MKNLQIGVLGYAGLEEYPKSAKINPKCYALAEEIGCYIGENEWFLVTGGKSGIMESAAKGSKSIGGTTIGVVCGNKRGTSNIYTDIEVVGNGYQASEEAILIGMCDIVVVLGGGAGTLQEIAVAYRMSKPIIIFKGIGGWSDRIDSMYLDEREKIPIKFVSTISQLKIELAKAVKNI